MKHTQRMAATAVTLTASALLLSACSTGTSGHTTQSVAESRTIVNKENWPERTPTTGLTKGLTLPLEAYMPSYADQVAVEQASNDLQESCMKGYGIDLALPRAGANPPPSDNDANIERRYGITDRAEAEKYGYELPPALREHTEQPLRELSDVEVEVLTGHTKPAPVQAPQGLKAGEPQIGPGQATKPARSEYNGKKLKAGGCVGWSKEQLGVQDTDPFVVAELSGDSLMQSMKDDKVVEAVAAWSACMDGKGHSGLADPYKAMDQGVTSDGVPTATSIALAVDDIDCKKQSDLVKIWSDVETAIQNKQIAGDRTRLTSIKEQRGKEIAAAREQMTDTAG